jgi:hypothetical protein
MLSFNFNYGNFGCWASWWKFGSERFFFISHFSRAVTVRSGLNVNGCNARGRYAERELLAKVKVENIFACQVVFFNADFDCVCVCVARGKRREATFQRNNLYTLFFFCWFCLLVRWCTFCFGEGARGANLIYEFCEKVWKFSITFQKKNVIFNERWNDITGFSTFVLTSSWRLLNRTRGELQKVQSENHWMNWMKMNKNFKGFGEKKVFFP